jgi:hypothetical protein
MKKRNLLTLIFGLCLSVLLAMPVYAQDPMGIAGVSPDGAEVQSLDEQTLLQEQEDLMENLPFAFGEFPSFTVSTIDAWSFQEVITGSNLTYVTNATTFGRSRSSGGTQFFAPIENIPTGAVAFGFQIEACDTNGGDDVLAYLYECPLNDYCTIKETISTGISATPGCTTFDVVIDPLMLWWNLGRTYYINFLDSDLSDTTLLRAVRIAWARGISPAPGSATFNDVGTGAWYFQGVEALAAAGITKGCNPPTNNLFCPNSAVTRAQMAVFLARALGLHWPG